MTHDRPREAYCTSRPAPCELVIRVRAGTTRPSGAHWGPRIGYPARGEHRGTGTERIADHRHSYYGCRTRGDSSLQAAAPGPRLYRSGRCRYGGWLPIREGMLTRGENALSAHGGY